MTTASVALPVRLGRARYNQSEGGCWGVPRKILGPCVKPARLGRLTCWHHRKAEGDAQRLSEQRYAANLPLTSGDKQSQTVELAGRLQDLGAQANLQRFWFELHSALTKWGIPMALRTERVADVGWGAGLRVLIDSLDRVSTPDDGFVPMDKIIPLELAAAIWRAYQLTRTQRKILDLIRDGEPARCCTRSGTAYVAHKRVRISTLDRLAAIGLLDQQSCGASSDYEYVAVQPASVRR